MTERDRSLFDNGVDFISDPVGLHAGWFDSWEAELEQRIQRADVVALVEIGSVSRSERGAEGEATYVLTPEPERVLKGAWPEDTPLVSGSRGAGFGTLERGREQVLDGLYVLFAKWEQTSDGSVQPRWHLSRAAGDVLETVSRRFPGKGIRTVVVRQD